ncbi:hypothetical protein HBH89_248790 [Parastagonospora nodorum]|nr:hypothetical protein HBH89_248790 [Parastagonospora nodorum]
MSKLVSVIELLEMWMRESLTLESDAAYWIQDAITEAHKQEFFFPDHILRSMVRHLPDSKNRVIPQWSGDVYTEDPDLLMSDVLRHPSGRALDLEDSEDLQRLVFVLLHGTPHAIIRGGGGLPVCDQCRAAAGSLKLRGCHQVGLKGSKRATRSCSNCYVDGKKCSLTMRCKL